MKNMVYGLASYYAKMNESILTNGKSIYGNPTGGSWVRDLEHDIGSPILRNWRLVNMMLACIFIIK
jgi:hypothetical protein